MGLVFSISNSFINKSSLANKWMSFSCSWKVSLCFNNSFRWFPFSVFPQKVLFLLWLQEAIGFNIMQWCTKWRNILQIMLWQKFRTKRLWLWWQQCACYDGWWTWTICQRSCSVSKKMVLFKLSLKMSLTECIKVKLSKLNGSEG